MINDMTEVLPKNETQVVDLKTMDPWLIIVNSAKAAGITINKPKENCKHCHGRGYVGRHANTGEPVACNCIFPKETLDRELGQIQYRPRNRAERRAMR